MQQEEKPFLNPIPLPNNNTRMINDNGSSSSFPAATPVYESNNAYSIPQTSAQYQTTNVRPAAAVSAALITNQQSQQQQSNLLPLSIPHQTIRMSSLPPSASTALQMSPAHGLQPLPRIRAVLPSTPVRTPTVAVQQTPPGSSVRSMNSNSSSHNKVKDEIYKRKHHLLKKCIKSLIFENAALSDEVARLNQRIITVTEERKLLLRRLLTHQRTKEKRRTSAALKKAAKKVANQSQQVLIQPTKVEQLDNVINSA